MSARVIDQIEVQASLPQMRSIRVWTDDSDEVPAYYLGMTSTNGRLCDDATSSGSFTKHMSRSPHVACEDIINPIVVFPNWCFDKPGQEREEGVYNQVTITASIEYPAGVFTQCTFYRGLTSARLIGYDPLWTDPVRNIFIPKGALYWVRSYRVVVFGEMVFSSLLRDTAANGEEYEYSTTATDKTMGGTIVSNVGTTINRYGPLAILSWTKMRSYAVYGDSRVEGIGDSLYGGQLTMGEICRSLEAQGKPYINLGCSGDSLAQFLAGCWNRAAVADFSSDIIDNLGVNDCRDGTAAATTIANKITFYGLFPNKRRHTITISPVNSSPTVQSRVDTVNAWIKSGAAPVDHVYDVAAVTTAPGGGWVPAYSSDGLHANSTGTAAILASGVVNPPSTPPTRAQIEIVDPGLHPDAYAYLDQIVTAPPTLHGKALNRFVLDLRPPGFDILSKFDGLYLTAFNDLQTARLRLGPGAAGNLAVVGSPTFSRTPGDRGVKSPGTGNYLDSLWNPAVDVGVATQNLNTMILGASDDQGEADSRIPCGNATWWVGIRNSSNQSSFRAWSAASTIYSNGAVGRGQWATTRFNSGTTVHYYRHGDDKNTASNTSTTSASQSLRLLTNPNNVSGACSRKAFYIWGFGTGLSNEEMAIFWFATNRFHRTVFNEPQYL